MSLGDRRDLEPAARSDAARHDTSCAGSVGLRPRRKRGKISSAPGLGGLSPAAFPRSSTRKFFVTDQSLKLTFPGGAGDDLAARLDLPDGPPRAYALFAHCFTCSKDVAAASRLSRALCGYGYGVLRFDFTGIGNSDGDFGNTSFSSNLDDLVAAADYLREAFRAPTLLVGHSLGGAAVLAAADRIPEARAVATIAAPSDPAHLKQLLAPVADEVRRTGEALVELGGKSFPIRAGFLEDLERHALTERLASSKRALLILHSPTDSIVGIDHARKLFEAARHPKSFVSLDDADHLLGRKEDALYAAGVLAAWAARYVGEAAEEPEDPEANEAEAEQVERGAVLARLLERFTTAIQAGPHALLADEPPDVGGADRGATPYDLVLAGLGACTAMTLRMYADRKEWPLAGARVHLTHAKVHAADCDDCDENERTLDRIERRVTLEGELDEAQRARLLEIADRCPVHKTLTGRIEIETALDDA